MWTASYVQKIQEQMDLRQDTATLSSGKPGASTSALNADQQSENSSSYIYTRHICSLDLIKTLCKKVQNCSQLLPKWSK